MPKRFQESNLLIKIFRYRWYLMRPFWFISWILFFNEKGIGTTFRLKCLNTWKLTAGIAQSKMHWYYTSEELFEELKKYKTRDKDPLN